LDSSNDGLLLDNRTGERLFAVDVLLMPRRRYCHNPMPVIRQRQHHGINIGTGQ